MEFLLELFSEEIPAGLQHRAAEDLARLVSDALMEAGVTYREKGVFVTPRRLTLTMSGVAARTENVTEERRGPRVDAPEKALEGFLRNLGLTKEALEIREDKKGATYYAKLHHEGRATDDVLAEIIPSIIQNFPWPKSMRWGDGRLRWVRPLRSILCILCDDNGSRIVPFEIAGLKSGNITYGHRFHAPDPIIVSSIDQYCASLSRAYVMLDPEERADVIWNDAVNQAFALGLEVVDDPKLLDEVAGLVEHPVVLMGKIDENYLSLPSEVLRTSMREHQKYLSVRDPKSGKIERFVAVANRETSDDGATILSGNQRVLSARLADAKFFWENDLRTPLEAMTAKLSSVTFHNKLGSIGDQVERIVKLSAFIAPFLGADEDLVKEAARYAKADLSSEMVYEFPELQGIMGRYYADHAGLAEEIGQTSAAHRAPLGPSDSVPTKKIVVAVALAEKIDLLTAFWSINEKPTGSKDPFALRRAALGVIRILLENGINIHLIEVMKNAYPGADLDDLMRFFHERLKNHLRDKGLRGDIIEASIAMPKNDDLCLVVQRAEALRKFLETPEGGNLLQGFRRANNILSAEEEKDGVSFEMNPDVKFAQTQEERDLFDAVEKAASSLREHLNDGAFEAALRAMAELRKPIDAFFETAQINTESQVVRRNRLCLLNKIRYILSSVADFSRLEG